MKSSFIYYGAFIFQSHMQITASSDINKDPQWGGVIWISCDRDDCGVLTVLNFGFQDFQGEEYYFWSGFDLI